MLRRLRGLPPHEWEDDFEFDRHPPPEWEDDFELERKAKPRRRNMAGKKKTASRKTKPARKKARRMNGVSTRKKTFTVRTDPTTVIGKEPKRPSAKRKKVKRKTVQLRPGSIAFYSRGKVRRAALKRGTKVFRARKNKSGNMSLSQMGGFSMKGLEKFIKPVLLMGAGGVAMKLLDTKFMKSLASNATKSPNGQDLIRVAIAMGLGTALAGFGKKEEYKLIGVGIAGSQLIDFLGRKAEQALSLNGMSRSLQGVRKIGGAVGNRFSMMGVGTGNTAPHAPWHNRQRRVGSAGKARASGGVRALPTGGEISREFPV